MQRIINGVGQRVLGTCRCPQCSGHSGEVALSFGRRIINGRVYYPYPGSATFWLSGIFAVAATFDAGQKIRRREQWDTAIAEQKRQLGYSTAAVAEEEDQAFISTFEYIQELDTEEVKEPGALARLFTASTVEDGTRQKKSRKQQSTVLSNSSSDDLRETGYAVKDNAKGLEEGPRSWGLSSTDHHEISVSSHRERRPEEQVALSDDYEQAECAVQSSAMKEVLWNPFSSAVATQQVEKISTPLIRAVDMPHPKDEIWLAKQQSRSPRSLEDLLDERHFADIVNPGTALLDQIPMHEQVPTTLGGDIKQHCLAPESIYLSQPFLSHTRGTWSPKKAETVRLAMNTLQLRIVEELYDIRKEIDVSRLSEDIKWWLDRNRMDLVHAQNSIDDALRAVKISPSNLSGYRPTFTTDNLKTYGAQGGNALTAPIHMNQALQQQFGQTLEKMSALSDSERRQGIVKIVATMLAKIHDILQSSKYPPDLRTYNILIAGFSDCRLKTMTADAIRALRRSHLRPNEATVSTILQHYTRYGKHERYQFWTELLEGKHEGLARSRHSEIADTHLQPILKYKEKLHPNEPQKVIQLQSPNPKLLGAIIAGAVHFKDTKAALAKIEELGIQDWGLSMDALGPLLRDCANRIDMKTGEQFWTLICQLETKAKQHFYLQPERQAEPIPHHVFAAMMDLCKRAEATERYLEIEAHARDVWPDSMQDILSINNFKIRKTMPVSRIRKVNTTGLAPLTEPRPTKRDLAYTFRRVALESEKTARPSSRDEADAAVP